MTQSLTFAAMVRIYRAGSALWGSWVRYRDDRSWDNLRLLLGDILLFASEVNAAAPALAPAAAGALLAAAQALVANVSQLRLDYSII
jgi:hypothetical protein